MRTRTALLLIVLLWLPVAPAYALFEYTAQKSLEWVVGQIDAFLPGTLTYDKVEGALKSPIVFEGLHYRDATMEVTIQRLELRWELTALFTGTARINLIQARGVEVQLGPPLPEPEEEPAAPFSLPEIRLPIALELKDVNVRDVRVQPPAGEPVVIDRVELKARTEETTLVIDTFRVQAPQGAFDLAGRITPVGAYPMDLQVSWRYQDPQAGPLDGRGTLQGNLADELSVQHSVSGALSSELSADLNRLLEDPAWSGRFTLNAPDLGPFVPELAGAGLTAELESSGGLDDYRAEGSLHTTALPEVGAVDAGFRVSGGTEAVRLEELKLTAADSPMALTAQADVDLAAQTIDAAGEWQKLAWPLVGEPQVQSPSGRFTAQGTFQDYRLSLETVVAGAGFGTLDVRLAGQGTDQDVRLSELVVRVPDGELVVKAQGGFVFAEQRFEASGIWQDLTWPLVGPPQVQSPQGEFHAQGTPQDYQARVEARLIGPEDEPLQARVEAAGSDRQVRITKLSLKARDGAPALDAEAELAFADLAFSAEGEWQDLTWPLVGEPQMNSPQGTFSAGGNPDGYQFRLNARLQGPNIPQSEWHLEGKGTGEALEQARLNGRLLDGELAARLSARWQPQVSWQVEIDGSGLNPGVKWPELPGRLRFLARSSGQISEQGIEARVELENLEGRLRDQDVSGQADVAVAGDDLTIDTLSVQAGNASLTASGRVAERWDLDWRLQVPAVARLVPGGSGRIQGSGSVSGPRAQPQAALELTADELGLGDASIRRLRADAALDLSGASRSRLELTAADLVAGGQRVQRLVVEGGGTPAAHTLQARLSSEPADLELALEGSGNPQEQTWRGRLTQLAIRDTAAGDWTLEEPVALRASAREAGAEQLCLGSRPSRICVQGRWSVAEGASGRVVLREFDFDRFADALPEGVAINTRLSGELQGSTRPEGGFRGEAALALSPGSLRVQAPGRTAVVELQEGSLRAEFDPQTASARLRLDLGSTGQVRGDAQVRGLSGQPQVNGEITAAIEDLGIVSAFAPQLQNTRGRLTVNLDLSGGLPVPVVSGQIRIIDAAAEVPELAIEIEDVDLMASADGGPPWRIIGSARSGPGRLRLEGRALEPDNPQVRLDIQGERFQVMNTPEIQVLVSPELDLAVGQNELRVEGEVVVPEASISPPKGVSEGGAVAPSPDVVIVRDAAAEDPIEKTGLDVYVAVRVILGEQVRVAVPGFEAELIGNLLVEQTPQLAARGTGRIAIESGQYEVYGQELQINRGQLLFSGGPIDNPGLDLQVSREFADVEAGVNVRGTLKNPEFVLFSDPAMPDTSILSYLVFGRPPDARSGAESELLLKAAAGLGFGGGNLLAEQFSETLGLDTLEFETGDTLEQSSLVLGKYLTPDLYVSYGIGLFEAINTFTLRYNITKRLTLESSAGTETATDLLYTIER